MFKRFRRILCDHCYEKPRIALRQVYARGYTVDYIDITKYVKCKKCAKKKRLSLTEQFRVYMLARKFKIPK